MYIVRKQDNLSVSDKKFHIWIHSFRNQITAYIVKNLLH